MIRLMFLIPNVLYTIRHVRVSLLVSIVSFKGLVYHLSSDTLWHKLAHWPFRESIGHLYSFGLSKLSGPSSRICFFLTSFGKQPESKI